jgi:hypothetical protein
VPAGLVAPWLAAAVVLFGCGRADLARVEGTVSYRGKPLEQGRVGFHPAEGRPAFGDVRQGAFTLTTYEPGDGALIGLHRVTVHSDVPADPNDAFSDRVALIPTRYAKPETSGLTAEVKPGAANLFRFDLTD